MALRLNLAKHVRDGHRPSRRTRPRLAPRLLDKLAKQHRFDGWSALALPPDAAPGLVAQHERAAVHARATYQRDGVRLRDSKKRLLALFARIGV